MNTIFFKTIFRANKSYYGLLFMWAIVSLSCNKENTRPLPFEPAVIELPLIKAYDSVKVATDIKVAYFFEYIDSIQTAYDAITPYQLTEHLLIRSNPWIIDTLQCTDYYRMIAKDSFVYDQTQMVVIPKGARLLIPDSTMVQELLADFEKTLIDVNLPEFKLRILRDNVLVYDFPIRVGRYQKKYLEMSRRIEDLRTKTGSGSIVGYNLDPRYVNPANNHEYFVTRRDDDSVTKLPRIPFIETEINGMRYGQMIHPTTNPETLGKAYSNGCIGTKEGDAWVIYYNAPLGTKINIRYDLEVLDKNGDTLVLEDIYNKY